MRRVACTGGAHRVAWRQFKPPDINSVGQQDHIMTATGKGNTDS